MTIIKHEYLFHRLFSKIKDNRFLYIILHILLHTSYLCLTKRSNTINCQVFCKVIQEDSSKSYFSIGAHHQTIEYSISQQILIRKQSLWNFYGTF